MSSNTPYVPGNWLSVPARVPPVDPSRPLTVPGGIPSLERRVPESLVPPTRANEVLIVTGRSGAGRTRAANALEDLDWYVVDNLPPALLLPMAGMLTPDGGGVRAGGTTGGSGSYLVGAVAPSLIGHDPASFPPGRPDKTLSYGNGPG